MSDKLFKVVFSLEYLQKHVDYWRKGEAAVGRPNSVTIDVATLQNFLATHPDAALMLKEAKNPRDIHDPLSATATDLIFTYLDEVLEAASSIFH
ncbi:hypothetical protein FM042_07995 [Aliidiomarina halalkaliphila]|uniref:Uncharacterized protein n=2 Tax=Aliidiomarina halalkaliphila TaxID=2593535 RepID=A0A552X1M4_9GAMM|nr:hypothetical protein FM042_07995 [Aliidiomarina halalkaliphila]